MSEVPYIGTDNKVDTVRKLDWNWNANLRLLKPVFEFETGILVFECAFLKAFSDFCRDACQLKSVCKFFCTRMIWGSSGIECTSQHASWFDGSLVPRNGRLAIRLPLATGVWRLSTVIGRNYLSCLVSLSKETRNQRRTDFTGTSKGFPWT